MSIPCGWNRATCCASFRRAAAGAVIRGVAIRARCYWTLSAAASPRRRHGATMAWRSWRACWTRRQPHRCAPAAPPPTRCSITGGNARRTRRARSDAVYAAMGQAMAAVPLHWRSFLKHELFQAMATAPAPDPLDRFVAALTALAARHAVLAPAVSRVIAFGYTSLRPSPIVKGILMPIRPWLAAALVLGGPQPRRWRSRPSP